MSEGSEQLFFLTDVSKQIDDLMFIIYELTRPIPLLQWDPKQFHLEFPHPWNLSQDLSKENTVRSSVLKCGMRTGNYWVLYKWDKLHQVIILASRVSELTRP